MSIETSILYDTSALIDFYNGNNETVKNFFIDKATENLIPTVVIAELISKIKREGQDPFQFVKMLEKNSIVLNFNVLVAKKAGGLHSELRKNLTKISLIDCMIMVHAEIENAMIITKDHHFKHYKNAKIL